MMGGDDWLTKERRSSSGSSVMIRRGVVMYWFSVNRTIRPPLLCEAALRFDVFFLVVFFFVIVFPRYLNASSRRWLARYISAKQPASAWTIVIKPPFDPFDGVVGVLQQIRASRLGQTIGVYIRWFRSSRASPSSLAALSFIMPSCRMKRVQTPGSLQPEWP